MMFSGVVGSRLIVLGFLKVAGMSMVLGRVERRKRVPLADEGDCDGKCCLGYQH